jgi:hypothetical protein
MITFYRLKYLIKISTFVILFSCSQRKLGKVYHDLQSTYQIEGASTLFIFVNQEFCGPCIERFSSYPEIQDFRGGRVVFVLCDSCDQVIQKQIRKKLKDFINGEFAINFTDEGRSTFIRKKLSLENNPIALKVDTSDKLSVIEYRD